jgi:glycosidase
MSYFVIQSSPSIDFSISAYFLSNKTLRIICFTPGKKYNSLFLRWQYRYINDNIYTVNVANLISSNNKRDVWEIVLMILKCDINFVVGTSDRTHTQWFSEIGEHNKLEDTLLFSFVIPRVSEEKLKRYLPVHPDWLEGCTLYQIFVDRFRRHEHKDRYLCWQAPPPKEDFFHRSCYGGSIRGIIHAIAFDGHYLKDLGVGAIYLTPVFEAPSNHKYDTSDYFSVDESFGTKEDLMELVKVAHENGIKVILDGVYNHCSDTLKVWQDTDKSVQLFTDIKINGDKSEFRDWVLWKNATEWEGFAGLNHIPLLNTDNDDCSDYLIKAAKYWTTDLCIDGWRLDVANELGDKFITKLRCSLEEIRPDIWLFGEILHNASNWLGSEDLSGATNHHWREIVIRYLTGEWSSNIVDQHLQSLWYRYPSTVYGGIVNYLSNHDTARIITAVNRVENYETAIKLSGIAAILLFTSMGTPLVYYGDEIGMEGGKDPDCRRCMEWDTNCWDKLHIHNRMKLKSIYANLISLRKQKPWLSTGIWKTILCGNDSLYIYKRQSIETLSDYNEATQEIIVVLNPGGEKIDLQLSNFCDKSEYVEIVNGGKYLTEELQRTEVSPYSGLVFSS